MGLRIDGRRPIFSLYGYSCIWGGRAGLEFSLNYLMTLACKRKQEIRRAPPGGEMDSDAVSGASTCDWAAAVARARSSFPVQARVAGLLLGAAAAARADPGRTGFCQFGCCYMCTREARPEVEQHKWAGRAFAMRQVSRQYRPLQRAMCASFSGIRSSHRFHSEPPIMPALTSLSSSFCNMRMKIIH